MLDFSRCKRDKFRETAAVACQGIEGAYSQMAANSVFIKPDIMYTRTFDGVFRAVGAGACQYGVLPLENSNAGCVTAVYDLMKTHNFYIARSVKASVCHRLLAKKNMETEHISAVYTHEQAAAQCSRFIEENPHIKLKLCDNTAVAAQIVSESEKNIAAIASENCANLYNLKILSKDVQNSPNNYTRFICISKDCEIYGGADKISLMLSLRHKAGALYEVIKQFADAKVNLTKIESRPIEGTDFEFMFYFDLDANIGDETVVKLLSDLEKNTSYFAFLGNYSEITQATQ